MHRTESGASKPNTEKYRMAICPALFIFRKYDLPQLALQNLPQERHRALRQRWSGPKRTSSSVFRVKASIRRANLRFLLFSYKKEIYLLHPPHFSYIAEKYSPAMKGNHLGEFEEIVLLTVAILYDEAYGVAVRDEIEQRLDRKVSLGAMHATLVRLEDKGLLRSRLGEATSKRGGKRKRHFQVTRAGQAALTEAREARERLWRDVPGAAFE